MAIFPLLTFLSLSTSSSATSTASQSLSGLLPAALQPYSGIIVAIAFFIDGVILGVAVKKGVLSFVLIIIGLLIASYFGLSITSLTVNDLWTHLTDIFASQVKEIGSVIYGIPILWLLGFLVGIWRG